MIIAEMIHVTEFKQIAEKIQLHYGACNMERFNALYERLAAEELPQSLEQELRIFITAYEENVTEDEPVAVLSFDENNTELQFDVSAYDRAETVYSIASINKSAFLCCEVDEDTLCHFTYASILAHCFWEITSYSFA